MNLKLIISLFLLSFLMLWSCSKDKDDIKPTVVINSPGHLFQVDGIDTIQVLASISDDRNIESVTVSVRNENDINVLANVSNKPNTKNYELNISYFFDNLQMEGGTYQLSVRAFDGENTTSEYVTILYNETPREREGVFVVSNTTSVTSFYLMDNNFNATFYNSVQGDHLRTVVDSYNQQLIHSSNQPGNLSTIDLTTGTLGWNVSPNPQPHYTGFYTFDQNLFLGKRDGGIQGFDKNGNPNFYTSIENVGSYTESMHIHNDQYLVSEERSLSTSQAYLAFYFMASGAHDEQTTLNSDIKGIYSKNNSLILLANNSSLVGEVLIFDFVTSVINTAFSVNIEEIEDCIEVSLGVYLVAEDGNLTIINANNHQTQSYIDNVGAKRIWFDEVTNELYVGNGSVLSIYDFSTKFLKGTYNHSSEIKDIAFWYNR
jgi:hypothetical protein